MTGLTGVEKAFERFALSVYAPVHLVGALCEVGGKQRFRPLGHVFADKRFYVEVYH